MKEFIKNTDEKINLMTRAMLDFIEKELSREYWNLYQKEIESPFGNTGNTYSNDYFTVRAYNWNEDLSEFNFETDKMKVSWYKHSNRCVQVYFKEGVKPYKTIAATLSNCVKSIEKDFKSKKKELKKKNKVNEEKNNE